MISIRKKLVNDGEQVITKIELLDLNYFTNAFQMTAKQDYEDYGGADVLLHTKLSKYVGDIIDMLQLELTKIKLTSDEDENYYYTSTFIAPTVINELIAPLYRDRFTNYKVSQFNEQKGIDSVQELLRSMINELSDEYDLL